MARVDIPLKVQLGCDDCYRFLLAKTAEFNAERLKLRHALTQIMLASNGELIEHPEKIREVARLALASSEGTED